VLRPADRYTKLWHVLCRQRGNCDLGTGSRSPLAFLAVALLGVGNAIAWPAFDALLADLVEPGRRPGVFSVRHATLNAGMAVGALVAGLVVDTARPGQLSGDLLNRCPSGGTVSAQVLSTDSATCDRGASTSFDQRRTPAPADRLSTTTIRKTGEDRRAAGHLARHDPAARITTLRDSWTPPHVHRTLTDAEYSCGTSYWCGTRALRTRRKRRQLLAGRAC
jgi:hypothetical protein